MCVSPSFIHITRGPRLVRSPVPCKVCWRCRSNRVNDYVGRCLAEAAYSSGTVSLTLTYAPRGDHAEKVITPPHFQAFIRALRKRGHVLRYLGVGEYGEQSGRAHFHAILFFKSPVPTWSAIEGRVHWPHRTNFEIEEWPHGYVFADHNSDEAAIRYVAKYLQKGEAGNYWFTCSKKPPLGHQFFQDKAAQAVDQGLWPFNFNYMPPAGDSSRQYLMRGRTRDYYLREVIRLHALRLEERGALEYRDRFSEWFWLAAEKLARSEHKRSIERIALEVRESAFADAVANMAPTAAQMRAIETALLSEEFERENIGDFVYADPDEVQQLTRDYFKWLDDQPPRPAILEKGRSTRRGAREQGQPPVPPLPRVNMSASQGSYRSNFLLDAGLPKFSQARRTSDPLKLRRGVKYLPERKSEEP